MVEVEFNMDANEETIAAANAAKATPLKPLGKKLQQPRVSFICCIQGWHIILSSITQACHN